MRNIIPVLILYIMVIPASAQTTTSGGYSAIPAEGTEWFHKSSVFGIKLFTDGYGISYEIGRATSARRAMLYQVELGVRKHEKEIKITSPYSYNPYIYGKENFVYPLRLNVQQQLLLGNKSNKNGVNVTANYGGGVSLALLRPYYIQVPTDIPYGNQIRYIKYDGPDSLQFLNGEIIGGPVLSKGWNELKVTPGINAKAAVRFDYGIYNDLVSAIEVGITGEYYIKGIPQMVLNKDKQFFINGYVSIQFGKRK